MVDVKLYKDISDASEVKRVEPGTPIYKIISPENKIAIVNGQEKPFDYILKENDVCIVRTIPEAAGLFIAGVFIFIAATVAVGVGMGAYQTAERARKKAENLSDEIENIPYLKGASNAIATGRTQPYIIGKHLFTPYILSQPHYSVSGTDGINQYYYLLLEGGFGKQILEKLYADDILIKTFTGTTPHEGIYEFDAGLFYDENSFIEISQDGSDFATAEFNKKYITIYPANELKKADDAGYADLIYQLPRNSRNVSVEINFKGLRAYKDSDGTKINRTVVVNPFYSLDDGETWTPFTFDQNGTPSNTFTRNTSNEMRFTATKEFLYSEVSGIDTPVKIKLVCPTNEYEGTALDSVTVSSIKTLCYDIDLSAIATAFVNEKPIGDAEAALSTRIAICIKATEQNKEKLNKINIITNGIARTWSGSEWSATRTPTSNLAAWVLEVLGSWTHGPSIVEDSEIDLDKFGEFYEYCETNGITVNMVLTDGDEKTSVLTQLCNIGSSALYENIYGEISIAWDAVKGNAIAVLNAQNVLSFEVSREFSRETDGLLLNYVCASSDYQDDSYLIMRDGVTRTSDSIIQELSIKGITDYQQLAIYARRLMAIEKLRRRKIKAQVGKEGLYYTPLEKLLVQHPALSIGLGSAEIKSTIIDGDDIIGVELYEPIEYNSVEAAGYGVIIQSVSDTYCTTISAEYTALTNGRVTVIYFETPIALSATAIPHAGDILSWGLLNAGEFDLITSEMLISGIASNKNGYEIDLVDYNAAIYEPGTIPDYTPTIAYKSEAGIAQNITSQIIYDEAAGATAAAIAAQATATAATTSLAPAAIAQYNPAYTPELPDDPAGVAYQPTFATTDSWAGATNNTVSVSGGRLISTLSATGQLAAYRAVSFSGGKMWTFYFEEQYGDSYRFRAVIGGVSIVVADVAFTANTRQLVSIYIPSGTVSEIRFVNLTNTTRSAGSTAKIDMLYIGTGAYISPTLDTSGNGNHLTNTAAVPVSHNGRKWWAFNGATSNLVATTAILGATGFFSRRIRTPAAFTEQFICGNLSGNTGCALKIMTGGTLRLAVGNGSTVVNLDTTVAASTEYWIACYIGATSATLYKDGAIADTDTVTMSASSTAWAEGKNPASAANYWAGYTAEPYATTILPSAAQIRDLYYNGLPAELYTPSDYRIDTFDDDGKLSVEEKAALKTRWLEIYYLTAVTSALSTTSATKDGDFSAVTAEAIAAGLTAASAEVVLYVAATNAIRDLCWNSSTGVLNNMAAPSTVTAGALDELLSEYRTAYNGLKQAILNQRVTSSSTLDPIQSNGYHQVPVDSGGTPTTYVGTNNLIQVFEGITHLQATTGTPGNGQFKVVATGTNITAGAVSVSGLDAAIADASGITADAAYITFAITGKSSAGTAFSIYLSQTITKSRAGADAVVYSLATSVGTARVNSAGTVSPSTVSATRYKKVGAASKAVTTDGTLKYKRSSDAGETATTNGTGISIAATDTYIDFFFYDASAVLDVTVRVPIIVDGQIADVATYAPRYLGVGLLAADDSATFRLDTVDSAGEITTGANTTAHVGDSMVNHDATNVALGIYVWSGTEWVITQDMARLSEVQTSIFALAQGGITIPGLAVVQTLMAQRLFAIETTIADTGWVKSANYAESGGYPTAGFMLDAVNEIIKAKGARFIDAEISGRFLGTNIYIKDDLMAIWSGASRLFPSVGDTKIMIALADVPGIDSFWSAFELYRCTTEGEWEYTGPVGIGTGGVRTPGPFYANRIHLGSITPSATMMKVVDDISNDYTSYRVDICGGYNIMQLTGKIRATLRVFWVYGSGWVTELDHEYFNTYPSAITSEDYIPLLTNGTTMTEWKANRLSTSQEMVVQVAMTFRSNIGLYGLNDVEFVEV